MGAYAEYLEKKLSFQLLQQERKKQLRRISELRGGRDVLVYASDFSKGGQLSSMDYSDILPFKDQLANLSGSSLDIIIETPGGIAEVAEDIINLVRTRYERVGMVVPGWAKSAGTIFVMAGDEILMGEGSALGPIDAQISHGNNKRFSAHAFLEGLDKIKQEVEATRKLNPAYIPILQNISPGEIQHCSNAQEFSASLVRSWLEQYKFKYWEKRKTSNESVTLEYKKVRASEIAAKLCDQSQWLTHGRSIRIKDLEEKLRLEIFDYSKNSDLNEAITRYYTLLRMTFETNVFKIYETAISQIYRFANAPVPVPQPAKQAKEADSVHIKLPCAKCGAEVQVQANLKSNVPVKAGMLAYPIQTDLLKCPQCGTENNMASVRLQLEAQTGKKIV